MVYMTTRDVARRLDVRTDTVKHWCRQGFFAGAFKLPGRAGWRIPLAAVEQLIASRQ